MYLQTDSPKVWHSVLQRATLKVSLTDYQMESLMAYPQTVWQMDCQTVKPLLSVTQTASQKVSPDSLPMLAGLRP